MVSSDLLVPPVEFRAAPVPKKDPVTGILFWSEEDAVEAGAVLRWNGDTAVSSRDKLIRWQEWYKKQRP